MHLILRVIGVSFVREMRHLISSLTKNVVLRDHILVLEDLILLIHINLLLLIKRRLIFLSLEINTLINVSGNGRRNQARGGLKLKRVLRSSLVLIGVGNLRSDDWV